MIRHLILLNFFGLGILNLKAETMDAQNNLRDNCQEKNWVTCREYIAANPQVMDQVNNQPFMRRLCNSAKIFEACKRLVGMLEEQIDSKNPEMPAQEKSKKKAQIKKKIYRYACHQLKQEEACVASF